MPGHRSVASRLNAKRLVQEMISDKWPYDDCDNAYDLGWKHGTEDINDSFKYRPEIKLTPDEWDEYKDGYKEARRGWD